MGDYISYIASQRQTVATYTYGNTTWGDMLTNYNGTAIIYDAVGNPLKWRNISTMTWKGRELQATIGCSVSPQNRTKIPDALR